MKLIFVNKETRGLNPRGDIGYKLAFNKKNSARNALE